MTKPQHPPTVPKAVALGLCLSLSAILLGFGLGGVFGWAEGQIKAHLEDSATHALDTAYEGDVAAKDAVVKKAWEYFKRAHFHWGGIGAASLGAILALVLLCRLGAVAQMSAVALGAGAIVYPLYWLCAGFLAPTLGSTAAAKEALSFLSIPGAGLCLLGMAGTLFCVGKDALFRRSQD